MFSSMMFLLISVILFVFTPETCISEVLAPSSLYLYSPGALDYSDVIVKRTGDNLTLACELRGDAPALYVWNFVPANGSYADSRPFAVESNGSAGSWLLRWNLSEADGGRYVCSAPPHSVAKQLLVQPHGGNLCATSALWCGKRCVLPSNVCDGRADCLRGEDEAPALCGERPCARSDRLNCSSGRCIPEAACCAFPHTLCTQHACCDEHPRHALNGYDSMEVLPPYEDRHSPDDYGFIQSTIYTVTACALIFMIAVVLLVSAICKMHMKRAALRSYAAGGTRLHAHYAQQRHRYPPCYEAAGLLQPPGTPPHDAQVGEEGGGSPRLTALAAVFGSRYSQVPTQCPEVEMLPVPSAVGSPARVPAGEGDAHDRQRLTLQLGRFHLSIPSFRRDPRPDTPNVAEINIDDLDFLRLNTNDTYTLNGRTIRLLNGNFENIPVLGSNPPPYNEAMRYKLYGPPPEYLSRDRLNRSGSVDEQARSNVELPPGYEELGGNVTTVMMGTLDEATNDVARSFRYGLPSGTGSYAINGAPLGFVTILNDGNVTPVDGYSPSDNGNVTSNYCIASTNGNAISIIGNVSSANGNVSSTNGNVSSANGNATSTNGNISSTNGNVPSTNGTILSTNGNVPSTIGNVPSTNGNVPSTNGNVSSTNGNVSSTNDNISPTMSIACAIDNSLPTNSNTATASTSRYETQDNGNNETLNSVIDNLPAIDSDVNANDDVIGGHDVAREFLSIYYKSMGQ